MTPSPDVRYPVGRFDFKEPYRSEDRPLWLKQLSESPANLRAAVAGLSDSQLDTPYRLGGWTVSQVVHHLADSHMNAFSRFRLALTEPEPTIKPYDEKTWAELADSRSAPVETSLVLLEGLHRRWITMLDSLSDADFARTFRHPEVGTLRLDTYLATYGWHCRHHVAHITSLRRRSGWA